MFFHASILFPLPRKSFVLCALGEFFLIVEAPAQMFPILTQSELCLLLCFHSVTIRPLLMPLAFIERLLYTKSCPGHQETTVKNDKLKTLPSWSLYA